MPMDVDVEHFWKFGAGVYFLLLIIGIFFGYPFGIVFFAVFGIPIAIVVTWMYKSIIISDYSRIENSVPDKGFFDSVMNRGSDDSNSNKKTSERSEGSPDRSESVDDLEIEKIGYEE